MAKLSDEIEKFILDNFADDFIDISRNDLAEFFSCAPSQINYVLSTRFNSAHGFMTESRRGGGGYIRLIRLNIDDNLYLSHIIENVIGTELAYNDFLGLIKELERKGVISQSQLDILNSSCNPKALSSPFKIEDRLRANITKSVLTKLMKGEKDYDM